MVARVWFQTTDGGGTETHSDTRQEILSVAVKKTALVCGCVPIQKHQARKRSSSYHFHLAGFTPALRSGCTAFKGAAVSAQTTGRMTGPVMADAWVRVVPSDSVGANAQADRLG